MLHIKKKYPERPDRIFLVGYYSPVVFFTSSVWLADHSYALYMLCFGCVLIGYWLKRSFDMHGKDYTLSKAKKFLLFTPFFALVAFLCHFLDPFWTVPGYLLSAIFMYLGYLVIINTTHKQTEEVISAP